MVLEVTPDVRTARRQETFLVADVVKARLVPYPRLAQVVIEVHQDLHRRPIAGSVARAHTGEELAAFEIEQDLSRFQNPAWITDGIGEFARAWEDFVGMTSTRGQDQVVEAITPGLADHLVLLLVDTDHRVADKLDPGAVEVLRQVHGDLFEVEILKDHARERSAKGGARFVGKEQDA